MTARSHGRSGAGGQKLGRAGNKKKDSINKGVNN